MQKLPTPQKPQMQKLQTQKLPGVATQTLRIAESAFPEFRQKLQILSAAGFHSADQNVYNSEHDAAGVTRWSKPALQGQGDFQMPNCTIEKLPMNWSIVETGDDTLDCRYAELWSRMFCDWYDYHYGWADLSLCGDELIGDVKHADRVGLPESIYTEFQEWVGGDAFEKMDSYDALSAGGDLSDVFGPSNN